MPTNYYVSPYGSDSNNGLGPDPTHATNRPYLTLGKAIGASALPAAGDAVYLAPGAYTQANFSLGVSGSSGSPISILGDPLNLQGFKDGSGNLLSAGEVRIASANLTQGLMNTNGKSYLAFSNLWLLGGSNSGGQVAVIGGNSHDLTFAQCMFQGSVLGPSTNGLVTVANTSSIALNVTFDRCILVPMGTSGVFVTLAKNSSADYSANVVLTNCLVLGGAYQLRVGSSGSGSFLGGGVTARNCSFLFGNTGVYASDAGISTTYPIGVYSSVFFNGGGNSFNVNTTGQVVEDYNIYSGATNMAAVSHSKADGSVPLLMDLGQWMLWGQNPRPFGTPTAGSGLLGFGNAAGGPGTDFIGRLRPEGGNSLSPGIGYLERHDTAARETTVTDSGGVGIRIDGPGSHEFQIPVDAAATTISVKCQYDANHGTTTPPQAILVAAPEIGVSTQALTAPATAGQWSTLSFSTITPSARGVVRVRLVARPAAANGKAYFDTFGIS